MNAATSTNAATATVSPLARRVVLGLALLAAFAVALPQRTSPALAQPAAVAAEPGAAPRPTPRRPAPRRGPTRRRHRRPQGKDHDRREPAGAADGAKARITVDASPGTAATPAGDEPPRSIVIEKDGRKVKVLGIHGDGEFDSFDEFLEHGALDRRADLLGRRHGVPAAAAADRADRLVQDAQEPDAERDDAEARREGRRPARRRARRARRRTRRARRPGQRRAVRAGARGAQARRLVRPAQGRRHGRLRPRAQRSTRCSTTGRRTASAWCCCSSASATSCSGGSRTAQSRTSARDRAARPRPARDPSAAVAARMRLRDGGVPGHRCTAHRPRRRPG